MAPLYCFFVLLLSLTCDASISEKTKIMNALLDPKTYDARVRPDDGSSPVKIVINAFVASLTSISESNMDFTIDIYLRQRWVDARLKHNFTGSVVVPPKFVDKIWYPDLFFSNEKRGELHTITQPNRYIRIASNGEVLLSQRFTLTLSCAMSLARFPFDSQQCGFKVESYGYNTENVVFRFADKNPVELSEETEIPMYVLIEKDDKKVETQECTKVYSTGAFTCLEAKMTFGRQIGFFIFYNYIPSFMIVVLTWFGLWISPSPPVTRFALNALCFVAMIGLIDAAKRSAPKVAYIVALDVWMIMSLVFIVLTSLETTFVCWLYHKGEVNDRSEEKVESGSRRKRTCCNWKGCAIKVDILCRLLIPALYVGWAAFYWFIYTKFDI